MRSDSKVWLFLLVNYFGGEHFPFYSLMLQSTVNKSDPPCLGSRDILEIIGELIKQYYQFSCWMTLEEMMSISYLTVSIQGFRKVGQL